jgi:dienelactone hydrolase
LLGSLAVAQSPVSPLHTSVAPKEGEDIAKACEYDMAAPPSGELRAVFVIFERGRDMQSFYADPVVRSFAEKQHIALMMPRHCASKQYEDIDVDPGKGLGRSLLTALDQFAVQTKHPELSRVPLAVLGFSGAGSLAARLPAFAPDRIAAVVLANAGQFEPLGLDTVQHTLASVKVPEFILVGSKDDHVGTQRAYEYFSRFWPEGAPWVYVTQNGVPHCCVVNARDLILEWLDAVLTVRLEPRKGPMAPVDRNKGYRGYIQVATTDTHDAWKLPTSEVLFASTYGSHDDALKSGIPAGWLPTKRFAEDWKVFVGQTFHPALSMP